MILIELSDQNAIGFTSVIHKIVPLSLSLSLSFAKNEKFSYFHLPLCFFTKHIYVRDMS